MPLQERQGRFEEALRLFDRRRVAGLIDRHQARMRDPGREVLAVGRRHQPILRTPDDQHRQVEPRQRGLVEEHAGIGAQALAEAQALGYAEDPPTLDVGGFDTAHKLTVMARFCADGNFPYSAVEVQGIEGLTLADIEDARKNGEKYKLVAELERHGSGWKATVAPKRLPETHALCTAGASRNALVYEGEECGTLIFAGGGAGGMITASAMVGDLLDYLLGFPGHVPLH